MLNNLSRRCFCNAASASVSRPWLFIGLGNPGDKYKGTRHNVGFEMIDSFAELLQIPMNKLHSKAIFGEGFVGEAPVLLAKPQTYMNLSGESLLFLRCPPFGEGRREMTMRGWFVYASFQSGPLAAYYKLPLNRVIVLHDDRDFPCGVLRLQPKGGHGSHNGLKSVIHHFRGNREFARLRIGVGRPPGQMDPKAFVLQKFNATARERIDNALRDGADALKSILVKGVTETARCFNQEQKYKHMRMQTMPT
ncbi:peptidyl-tRNA hydrolase, mitochondrial isoform X1 [Mercurialis annua]|uniref:peptidyl-tRNA hydrolase, mitochondrial isoform X1 n=1 Tax=Mercurialis annua TaxID=3986 RepID=UPI00215F9621|nr:peptidyl-tRNA hydrolase, mitochondrial isoform X1 [Mercurialis annua]